MIKNIELLYNTCSLLKNTFGYKIEVEENEKEVSEPTFFVKVNPLTTDSFFRYQQKLTNIIITYVDEVITQESLLDIQEKLNEIFDMTLQVDKRKIVFDKKSYNITKDFITLTLTLDYLDDKTIIPDGDKYTALMQELLGKGMI